MHIAIEGCAHGELNTIYDTIKLIEEKHSLKIDLLLCCGDFEAIRNQNDLQCMAVPPKYRHMQHFWEYYCGKRVAPVLTIFIGGNHEATNYLQELAFGGWVAPNIYYLGYAGVVQYKGLRIGGLSGIFKQYNYAKGHYEKLPYNEDTKRSAYHVRQVEVFRLCQLRKPIDIMMSHDWPNEAVNYGDVKTLLRKKRHFTEDVNANRLGSNPAWKVLKQLRPRYWFSGHLHVKYTAVIDHQDPCDKDSVNKNVKTKFLALDKCLPGRSFLQVLNLDEQSDDDSLMYDAEWLAVLKETNQLTSISRQSELVPTKGLHERWNYSVSEDEINQVLKIFDNDLKIPSNFVMDQELVHDPEVHSRPRQPDFQTNPQTSQFCAKLQITDPLMMFTENFELSKPSTCTATSKNPDEIDLDDDDDELSTNVDDTKVDQQNCPANSTPEFQHLSTSTRSPKEGSQKFKLSLPLPKFNQTDETKEDLVETIHESKDDTKIQPTDFVKDDTKVEETDHVESKNINKKIGRVFVRRNASIYSSTSDPNDD